MVVRKYEDELKFIEKIDDTSWRIKKGFQPNMNVEGVFYVNKNLEKLMFEELRNSCKSDGIGGFLPGMKQIANVAALQEIIGLKTSLGKSIDKLNLHTRWYNFWLVLKTISWTNFYNLH